MAHRVVEHQCLYRTSNETQGDGHCR
jgi:hypothetical protein